MSDSRLEKFIYAICSMDVSDLPVPLSRIEKLWNCLITGETPDFEPLSRNEKYLMAMLDRYDISNLPAPMSRGEKLLYKIAVGETDLSDVPGYLSRYEELLKYLIENGGISGGDFEYVLYTLNQSLNTLYTTAEKPVKSAILKGQTLVNLIDYSKPRNEYILKDNDTLTVTSQNESIWFNSGYFLCGVTYGKTYRVMWDSLTYTHTDSHGIEQVIGVYSFDLYGNQVILDFIKNSNNYFDFTIPSNIQLDKISVRLHATTFTGEQGATTTVKGLKVLEYQQGMENWDIPYFEGMQSVKMPVLTTTGKNLFDVATQSTNITINLNNGLVDIRANNRNTSDFINVVSGKTYKSNTTMTRVALYNNGSFVRYATNTPSIQIKSNENQLRFSYDNSLTNIQLEEGSVATDYEPYKSNILTVNEEVELRGIRDVRDTLDLMTGEKVERIGEIVFDGSENWVPFNMYDVDGYSTFVATIPTLNNLHNDDVISIINDKFASTSWRGYLANRESETVWSHDPNKIGIRVKSEKASNVEEIKEFLSTNNIRINYTIATESIKTVDLTVVDQDNQPTQLGTFENVTHVSLESAGLIPEVEMEVATHISEELASASPLMDDISTKQEQLNTMVDEQSNNVDATMIATTEIYEETL